MRPTFDISVRYFGIDWTHLSRVSRNLIWLTNQIIDVLRRNSESGHNPAEEAEIDLALPSNVLRNLATIEADVGHHAEAVACGRLSWAHLKSICTGQARFRQGSMEEPHVIPVPPPPVEIPVEDVVTEQIAANNDDTVDAAATAANGDLIDDESAAVAAATSEKRGLWGALKDMKYSVIG